jgi:type I restriction-modification system DNA methylase subunit
LTEQLAEHFKHGLEFLDMLAPEAEYGEVSGLVFAGNTPPDHYERIALEKAREYNVDAVYFRRFEGGRASIPQIYIYDYTSKEENADDIGELHRKLWNSGQVPLFFVFTKTEVKIFNCYKSPSFDPDKENVFTSPMETISLAAEVEDQLEEKRKRQEFSARKFDNGAFWDMSGYKDEFKLDDSSYETLLQYLKKIRNDIIKTKILEKPIIHKLLVMSILLKYLEERIDKAGNSVFPEGFFDRFAEGAGSFTDVLKTKGACLELFDDLSRHFNGEIFKWEDEYERELLSRTDLTEFAKFFEARIDATGQGTLWRIYSFNDLPIELISNIYEEFLGNEKGVVYTPPYLVHFLIDEVMPLESPVENFKVLDPACGSGVFLVAAYQRIIQWWRIRSGQKRPGLDILKKLLRENIFGIDISPEAVRLTIFSLSLVLLDALSPKEIWEDLKFDNLKSPGNLFEKDFFELILHQKIEKKFDLVIGNPPFIKELTPYAKQIEEIKKKTRVPTPNKQLALLFLEQSLQVCKPGGLLCMILPSGPFLYNTYSSGFRKYFLQSYDVKQILDFTSLDENLYGSSQFPTAVVFAKNESPNSKSILHVTFRRTKVSKEKIYLELDHYDLHRIAYEVALRSPLIWKANLLGGGRLHNLILRLSLLRTLGDYLKEKEKEDGWVAAEGFEKGDKNEIRRLKEYRAKSDSLTKDETNELKRLEKKYKKAEYLTGKKTVPTDAFTGKGIDESQIYTLGEEFFRRPRSLKTSIFKGPHLLIKEAVTGNSIPIAFRDDDISFMRQIYGIHAPENQRKELLDIEKKIKGNNLFLFYTAASSGRYMITRATALLKKDIDNLPYPEDDKELDLSWVEKILIDDVLDYMLEFRREGEKARAVQPVNRDQLHRFGEVYCKILNTVYTKFKPHKPIETDNYVCFPIYYGDEPQLETNDIDKFEQDLNRLIHKEIGRGLRFIRVLRFYDQNVIYLVKPKQIRYWLRSVAVRDADETFEDLVKQGY